MLLLCSLFKLLVSSLILRHVLIEDSSQHNINIGAPSGSRLKELPTKIKLEKIETASQALMPQACSDSNSLEINLSASPGNVIFTHFSYRFCTKNRAFNRTIDAL